MVTTDARRRIDRPREECRAVSQRARLAGGPRSISQVTSSKGFH